ncbi:MAG: DUF87 domain-containing protein [Peptostreptococcales bacterium]
MSDFEKLGVFYLGKEYDMEEKQLQEELVLLKSKDLTTHAVIIGMTGSGKTGLGISLIEEAAIDNIPVIAIDPKGDLGNLALSFPRLSGEEFKPWVNVQEARIKDMTADQYAQAQAELWEKGLADWGQDKNRIERYQKAADIRIYTPGGSAGRGVSILKSFSAPPEEILKDGDAYRDRISMTTTSLLSLIGVNGDPFTSREYILLSNILEHYWNQRQNLGLAELIAAIQKPPMEKVGIMDLESFYPSKERFSLAMMFNNLLASPSFKAWLEGEPLDVGSFLHDEFGKPRVSVFSIAHLSDDERMFFVTMLLNEILSWVRSQPGTGSLRAILYMDEIWGYLPPTANPPSKTPLLTLLKQARAFGLGLVLSTQNPVDLDYKALSNAGTWFIGRLQTERDKERVMSGLEGAAAGDNFDKGQMEKILSGLGQRMFYLHSVHHNKPVIFSTRWTLSYLAGPLTREQIASLSSEQAHVSQMKALETPAIEKIGIEHVPRRETEEANQMAPVLPPQIKQVYLPLEGNIAHDILYEPFVIGIADVLYNSAKYGVTVSNSYTFLAPLHEGPVALDWNEAKSIEFHMRDLDSNPIEGASYAYYPDAASNVKNYDNWKRLLVQFIRTNVSLKLFSNSTLKLVSENGEDERGFRIRLQHLAHEERDEALEVIRKKYASRITTLENRYRRAVQAVDKQNTMAAQQKLNAAVSAGSAILGALLGRKSISATSVSRMGTAVKNTSRALNSGQGIHAAQETLQAVETQLEELQLQVNQELDRVSEKYDLLKEKVESIEIRAVGSNITVHLLGLAWVPSTEKRGDI